MATDFDNYEGILTIECDTCGNEDVYNGVDFKDAIDEAKEDGWKFTYEGHRVYVHFCDNHCKVAYDFKEETKEAK